MFSYSNPEVTQDDLWRDLKVNISYEDMHQILNEDREREERERGLRGRGRRGRRAPATTMAVTVAVPAARRTSRCRKL